jgi:CHC2 zinc finger
MIALTVSEVAIYYAARVPDLRQRGKRWRGRCPIHRGKHDSFSVDPETGLWRCWSECVRGGDIITLEIELTGAPWRDAVAEIEGIVGRALLERLATHTERRIFEDRRRAASVAEKDIWNWGNAAIHEANAGKLTAAHAGDDERLARAASLCHLLENGSPADMVRGFIRQRASDPGEVARLIAVGRERDLEAQRITTKAVLLLAAAEALRDAA